MQEVYAQANRYFTERLQHIITTNNRAHRDYSHYGHFLYNGVKYSIDRPEHFPYRYVSTYNLIESLHAEADIYIAEFAALKEEIPLVSRFLTIMLNFVRTKSDIKYILGDTLYQQVKNYYVDDPTPRTEEDLHAFVNKHQLYIDMINQRYIDNILMSNVYNESKG